MFYVLQGSNTEKETLQQLVQLYQISKPTVKFALLANCG